MGMFSMAGEFLDTVTGPASSLVKNVFMDTVHPVVGSVVRTDLAFGLASHTGIYVGENRIVEITEVDDEARVQIVPPLPFCSSPATRMIGGMLDAERLLPEIFSKFPSLQTR